MVKTLVGILVSKKNFHTTENETRDLVIRNTHNAKELIVCSYIRNIYGGGTKLLCRLSQDTDTLSGIGLFSPTRDMRRFRDDRIVS